MEGLPALHLPKAKAQVREFGLVHDRFCLERQLSNGGQGEVHICKRMTTGDEFAVKIIDRRQLRTNQRNEVLLRREIRTLRELQHRNVVSLHDAFWEQGSCFIVMDLAREGDLREKVTYHVGLGQDDASSEYASRYVARQLVAGINYMHMRRVIHRDLKMENILVCGSRAAPPPMECRCYEVKITDFGLATWLDIVGEEMTPCGTPNYLAPEVMRENYDERVDFWSFGVVMYILLCGDFPFDAYRNPEEVERVASQPVKESPSWLCVSETAKTFVKGLLSFDPEKRLTHGGCLKHPWMAEHAGPSSAWADEVELIDAVVDAVSSVGSLPGTPARQHMGVVSSVSGWIGAAVDSIRITRRNGATQEFGGGGGGWAEIRYSLDPHEVILAVSQETRTNDEHLGNALTLYTSSCNILEFRGGEARRRRRFVAPTGSQVVGLQFNGSHLVGIHLGEIPENGATLGAIEEIGGRTGFAVDRITMRARGSGQVKKYGSTSGGFQQAGFQLEANEYIMIVEQARRDAYLGNSVAFFTSLGRTYKLSGVEASSSRRFAVDDLSQVCGLEFQGSLLTGVLTCPRHGGSALDYEILRHPVDTGE